MVKVLFVCLGNICRSPLAESIFMHQVSAMGLRDQFMTDSCGTSNYNIGSAPDPRTMRNAAENGIVLNHVARQLTRSDFEEFDRILVMDSQNLRHAMSMSDDRYHTKITMMRAFDPLGTGDVPDPYYDGDKGFQKVFEILDRSIKQLIIKLRSETHC